MEKLITKSGKKIASSQKIRFGLVGVINTAVDFAVLNVLVGVFGLPLVPANIASTATAMVVSYSLNKKAVFRGSNGGNARQLVIFVVVTLVGLWLIQSVVIVGAHALLASVTSWSSVITLNVAKVIGTVASLTWNYLWYSRVVFRQENR